MIRDLYVHMPTPNYVKHLSPTVDAIEKYVIYTMYQVPSDPTILAQHLKNILITNYLKNAFTDPLSYRLNCHCMRRDPNYLHSHPIPKYQRQSTQPCVPIQSSLPPYQTQSHNAHPPSQESHLPSPAQQQCSSDAFFRSTSDM